METRESSCITKESSHAIREIELLLNREATLASMSLGLGLTHLRRFDHTQPGFFYTGLISLTLAFERFSKIILIYDYRLNNEGEFPNDEYLKKFGHDLDKLFIKVQEIQVSHLSFLKITNPIVDDPLISKIISLLSSFARSTRYYNLNCITGKKAHEEEPLKAWTNEVLAEIESRHYQPPTKTKERLKELSETMKEFSVVKQVSTSGKDITEPYDMLCEVDRATTRQKYSMYYCYLLG